MDLKAEILALVESLGGEWSEKVGIITVKMPDGTTWDFTTPRIVKFR